jgi:hypothetical protein
LTEAVHQLLYRFINEAFAGAVTVPKDCAVAALELEAVLPDGVPPDPVPAAAALRAACAFAPVALEAALSRADMVDNV